MLCAEKAWDEQIVHNCYKDHLWKFYDHSELCSLKTEQDNQMTVSSEYFEMAPNCIAVFKIIIICDRS